MQNKITIAVSHFVKQGKEQAFEVALKQVIQQAKKYKGYEGIQVIQPNNKTENEYLLLIRFDNEENYQVWRDSDIRNNWFKELKNYIHKESYIRHQEGLEFWFSLPELTPPSPPTKWKMAILTWAVIYPLILGFSTIAGMYLDFLHPYLRTMVVSMILVTSMTYFLMPNVTKLFAKWIFKK